MAHKLFAEQRRRWQDGTEPCAWQEKFNLRQSPQTTVRTVRTRSHPGRLCGNAQVANTCSGRQPGLSIDCNILIHGCACSQHVLKQILAVSGEGTMHANSPSFPDTVIRVVCTRETVLLIMLVSLAVASQVQISHLLLHLLQALPTRLSHC